MGTAYLLDTNAISKGLRGLFSEDGLAFFRSVVDTEANFSVITRIELLGFNPEDSKTEQTFQLFISEGYEYELTEEIVQATINLRKTVKIKLPDAIIAATALVHKMTLVSDNDTDFLRVPKLKYVNPARL
ncbi:MAG: type II toxin-antitoxin system VapC family toxin [Cytophagales bacterium]|nr:MAG: type II toxin-antitoxin system VapC family toxin [Cytophagales bacterium]